MDGTQRTLSDLQDLQERFNRCHESLAHTPTLGIPLSELSSADRVAELRPTLADCLARSGVRTLLYGSGNCGEAVEDPFDHAEQKLRRAP